MLLYSKRGLYSYNHSRGPRNHFTLNNMLNLPMRSLLMRNQLMRNRIELV
jgi:hypothetical protein